MASIIVFGATGISGLAALSALAQTPSTKWSKIFAVSRRAPPLTDSRVTHVSVNLLGPMEDIARALKHAGAENVTHALFYSYVAKEKEEELVDINKRLFENSLNALTTTAKGLKVVLLQTGYKYYGVHKGGKYLAKPPFRADAPRHEGLNFYYVQEDMLRNLADKHGFKWVVSRPNFIVGSSKGNFMSLAVTIGQYASLLKFLNKPLIFPGSDVTYNLLYDFSSAEHNAASQLYLLETPASYDRAFNVHDGPPMKWSELWPKIARYFDMELPNPPATQPAKDASIGESIIAPHSAAAFATANDTKFDEMIKQYHLDPEGKTHATWDFLDFATTRTWEDLASLDELKVVGFAKEFDTWEDGFVKVFDEMRRSKIIPS